MDERSSCGLSIMGDLSKSHNQMAMTSLTPMGSALWTSIKELFLLPKFDSTSPSVTRDEEICESHVIVT